MLAFVGSSSVGISRFVSQHRIAENCRPLLNENEREVNQPPPLHVEIELDDRVGTPRPPEDEV